MITKYTYVWSNFATNFLKPLSSTKLKGHESTITDTKASPKSFFVFTEKKIENLLFVLLSLLLTNMVKMPKCVTIVR